MTLKVKNLEIHCVDGMSMYFPHKVEIDLQDHFLSVIEEVLIESDTPPAETELVTYHFSPQQYLYLKFTAAE